MTRRGVEEKSRIISASCTKDMKSSSFRHEIGNWEWMKSCWRWHKRRICESVKNVSWKCHILQQNYQRTIYLYLSWGSDGLYIWHYKSITIKLLWTNNPLSYRHLSWCWVTNMIEICFSKLLLIHYQNKIPSSEICWIKNVCLDFWDSSHHQTHQLLSICILNNSVHQHALYSGHSWSSFLWDKIRREWFFSLCSC